jgi:hypothetical protein
MDIYYNLPWLSVITAALLAFLLGAIWYCPTLFGNITVSTENKKKHNTSTYIFSFLFLIIAASAFSLLLGKNPSIEPALKLSLLVGIGFVASTLGVNYLYTNKGIKILLIDSGYHISQFIIYAIVFSYWP